jgi:hypothetical protein
MPFILLAPMIGGLPSRVRSPREEWLAVVKQDPALAVNERDFCEYKLKEGTVRRVHPIEWLQAEDQNCLWWGKGKIGCKNPSPAWVRKMVELAQRLNAKVIGDEGERYA